MMDIYPKPFVGAGVFATDDMIQQDPELVRRFVRATLEAISYLKENPSYASDLYAKRTNAPKDLADKVINSQIDWRPSGRGSGSDLLTGVGNSWQFNKDSGGIPPNVNVNIEDAIDVGFLP